VIPPGGPWRWPPIWSAHSSIQSALAAAVPDISNHTPVTAQRVSFLNRWVLINWVIVFAADLVVVFLWGDRAIMCLTFSFFFSIGLHPLGARWIQEHCLVAAPQETYSYYGLLNLPAFNVGYHNERHDMVSVPWNRLPALKAMAPEYYEGLKAHHSWTLLLLRWVFDRELNLFSRMIRHERAGADTRTQI
jgi:sphingolipid delta-4 desaturase